MTPSDISAARPEDQRVVLEAVWDIIARARGFAWAADNAQAFMRKSEAEAYLDAAMMMVPEGWTWGVTCRSDGAGMIEAYHHERVLMVETKWCATPALALCAAILQSKGGRA